MDKGTDVLNFSVAWKLFINQLTNQGNETNEARVITRSDQPADIVIMAMDCHGDGRPSPKTADYEYKPASKTAWFRLKTHGAVCGESAADSAEYMQRFRRRPNDHGNK